MFTVVRFSSPREAKATMASIGRKINEFIPGKFVDSDLGDGGFSVSICEMPDWHNHQSEIELFLESCGKIFLEAASSGLSVSFDVAIEPEDLVDKPLVSCFCDFEFLARLSDFKVSLEFSFYNPNYGEESR